MLTEKDTEKRKQIKMVSIEELVPENHLLRKIEAGIDFSFVREEVKDLYCLDNGRPSIDPVVLIKLCIINFMYGLNSMRRTIRECEVNLAYRWFLGYDLLEAIPHFTTFGKNYKRRFEGTDIFEKIFSRVLQEAVENNLVDTDLVYIDGTHIKANANIKKVYKEQITKEAKHYGKELLKEINADREEHNKKPFKDEDNTPPQSDTITKSKSDPESGLFHKGEHKKCFAYTAHTACDKNNFVLDVNVTSGNIHDSVQFDSLYKSIKNKYGLPEAVIADAGYKTPWICKQLVDDKVMPVMPYKNPMTKKGFFYKRKYIFDKDADIYICPENQVLKYTTTNRSGYREYKSGCNHCKTCKSRNTCTLSKNMTKVVTRHVWQDYIDKAEEIRRTPQGKELYNSRSETIERVFADAKEKHGMRFTRLTGLKKVTMQVLMTFTCMNLKKLIKMKEKLGLLASAFLALFKKISFSVKFKLNSKAVC